MSSNVLIMLLFVLAYHICFVLGRNPSKDFDVLTQKRSWLQHEKRIVHCKNMFSLQVVKILMDLHNFLLEIGFFIFLLNLVLVDCLDDDALKDSGKFAFILVVIEPDWLGHVPVSFEKDNFLVRVNDACSSCSFHCDVNVVPCDHFRFNIGFNQPRDRQPSVYFQLVLECNKAKCSCARQELLPINFQIVGNLFLAQELSIAHCNCSEPIEG